MCLCKKESAHTVRKFFGRRIWFDAGNVYSNCRYITDPTWVLDKIEAAITYMKT